MTAGSFLLWANRFPEAMMLVGGDGGIVACNSAFLELVRQPADAFAGKTLFDFAATPAPSVHAALRLWSGSGQLVHGPATFQLAGELVRAEGGVIVPRDATTPARLLVRVKRHEAAVERFTALNATIDRLTREVHARKRSEEEIRTQREWLQVTLSSIGDAVIATDVHGRVEFMNGAAEQLTGWQTPDALGQPMETVFMIFNEYTREPAEIPVFRVLKEGVTVGLANHTVLRAKDGTERPIEDSAAPIRNSEGTIVGVVLVFHDVSERNRVLRALQESERRFRLLTELNVIAAGVADLEGTFFEANDALLELLGFSREELAAGLFRWTELTPPEMLSRDYRSIEEAQQRGACQPYEKEYVRRDGRRVPVIIGYALFKAPQRHPGQRSDQLAICYIVDISERKQAEAVLEQRVEERTAKLQAAIADLEAFSYSISHDLRAPLRTMRSYAQILLEEHATNLREEARHFVARIIDSGAHLERLIGDVLTYTRVSKETHELHSVDLGRLLAGLVEQTLGGAPRGTRIECGDSVHLVRGNEALLIQCFSNLISNAVKFVPLGRAPHIQIAHELRGHRLRVSIRDNGIGIAPGNLSRIFRLFERLHPAAQYEGTGIGLSIVRRAVEKMGGTVGVESELGRGSHFWIELDAADPADSQPGAASGVFVVSQKQS